MACNKIAFILINVLLLIAACLSAPAEKIQEAESVARVDHQKEDLVSASEDLKPAASHWGGGWGGWGGHWGGHYGGYPYYGSYWGGWPSYGYGYGYWPYGGYGGYGGYGFGHHGYWW